MEYLLTLHNDILLQAMLSLIITNYNYNIGTVDKYVVTCVHKYMYASCV